MLNTVKDTFNSFNDLITTITTLREHTSTSLPGFTKPFIIESPLFVQKKVFDEIDLLNDVISSIYDLYVGYILLAVKVDTSVYGGRRVRDILNTVSTSSMLSTNPSQETITNYYETADIVQNFNSNNLNVAVEERDSKYIQSDSSRRLLTGRLIEVDVTRYPDIANNVKPVVTKIPIYLKLNLRIFPDAIANDIITTNISKSIKQRWLQYRAGEISFIKDFLMQLDLTSKRTKALRRDSSGILYDMLYQRHKGLIRRILKLSGANARAQNIFNSIFIFDRVDQKRAANEAGIKFDRYRDRQQFFNRNYAMFVVSVDNQHGLVDFYIDSIKQKGEYSFTQMKQVNKKDGFDIVEVIKSLQQQQVNMRVL